MEECARLEKQILALKEIKIMQYIYKLLETGDIIVCGQVKQGIDGAYIQWFE